MSFLFLWPTTRKATMKLASTAKAESPIRGCSLPCLSIEVRLDSCFLKHASNVHMFRLRGSLHAATYSWTVCMAMPNPFNECMTKKRAMSKHTRDEEHICLPLVAVSLSICLLFPCCLQSLRERTLRQSSERAREKALGERWRVVHERDGSRALGRGGLFLFLCLTVSLPLRTFSCRGGRGH